MTKIKDAIALFFVGFHFYGVIIDMFALFFGSL